MFQQHIRGHRKELLPRCAQVLSHEEAKAVAEKVEDEMAAMEQNCANAVADNEVWVLMMPQPDGSLKPYFNEQDTLGARYERCSR